MRYELQITAHVIDRYRERVITDDKRYSRDDEEISDIIIKSLREAELPKKISGLVNLLVRFRNPQKGEHFPTCFYLCVKRDEEDCGRLVVTTIEDVYERKKKPGSMNRHYKKFCWKK